MRISRENIERWRKTFKRGVDEYSPAVCGFLDGCVRKFRKVYRNIQKNEGRFSLALSKKDVDFNKNPQKINVTPREKPQTGGVLFFVALVFAFLFLSMFFLPVLFIPLAFVSFLFALIKLIIMFPFAEVIFCFLAIILSLLGVILDIVSLVLIPFLFISIALVFFVCSLVLSVKNSIVKGLILLLLVITGLLILFAVYFTDYVSTLNSLARLVSYYINYF